MKVSREIESAQTHRGHKPLYFTLDEISLHSPLARLRGVNYTFLENFEVSGGLISVDRNRRIYDEGEPVEHFFKIMSGTVRTCKFSSDGRRQISTFYLPGEIFGLEFCDEHGLCAEAVNDVVVGAFRRRDIIEAAERSHKAAWQLWALTAQQLQQAQDHRLLISKTAQERVIAFLLEMSSRTLSGNVVDLPMSRRDVADYLGLTIETISRVLAKLENDAAIALHSSRRIVLCDRLIRDDIVRDRPARPRRKIEILAGCSQMG